MEALLVGLAFQEAQHPRKAEPSMTYPNPGKNLLEFACHFVYQSPQQFDVNLLETGFVS